MNCTFKIPTIITIFIGLLLSFTYCKEVNPPSVTTANVTRIMQTTAQGGGQVTDDGGGYVTARGVCWSTSENPGISDNKTTDSIGIGLFVSYLTQLMPNTLYYVKAYATNSEGTVYGSQVSFTTDPVAAPTLTTAALKSLTTTTALSGGEISNDGGTTVTERGVCWNTSGNPTIADDHSSDGTGSGLFASTMTGLSISTAYYVRAYATNSQGTAYGNEKMFTQMEPVTDIDGNVYSIVTIGDQVWMGENLKTTKYIDGTEIPLIMNSIEWANMSTPAFCWYNNDENVYKAAYGALYNWYAVNTGKLCPDGWHVPIDAELTTLVNYLGGAGVAGGKLKEAGTSHWNAPNSGATDGSGFSAMPGGGRYNIFSSGGSFDELGYYGCLWSSSESPPDSAWSRDLFYNLILVNRVEYPKEDGESVRCIKN